MEYQYWSFMVSHPAHAPLPPESISKAIDVLTWSYTGPFTFSHLMLPLILLASDRLLPSPHSSLPPFSQEECQELLRMLHSFDREPSHAMIPDSLTYIPLLDLPAQAVSIVRTRVVSKV